MTYDTVIVNGLPSHVRLSECDFFLDAGRFYGNSLGVSRRPDFRI